MVGRSSQPVPSGSKLEPISEPENCSHVVARHDEDLSLGLENVYSRLPRHRKAIRLFSLMHASDNNNPLKVEISDAEFPVATRMIRISERTRSTDKWVLKLLLPLTRTYP